MILFQTTFHGGAEIWVSSHYSIMQKNQFYHNGSKNHFEIRRIKYWRIDDERTSKPLYEQKQLFESLDTKDKAL